ncbi:AAA family ATPase [Kiritimatiellaeota bacterium B1221]|nr:AAA family ATPase [Kiritimatiellaeota bacterium B1221]
MNKHTTKEINQMDDQKSRVNRLIERLELFQSSNNLSDVKFVSRFQKFLGSTKTWRQRLCARKWEELAGAEGDGLGKWEQRLGALVAELDGSTDMTQYLDKLPISQYAAVMYERLQGQGSDRRCMMLVGNYGVGKTWAMRSIRRNNIGETVLIEADISWRRSWSPIARALAEKLGAAQGNSAAATFQNVIDYLKLNPQTLLVDEGHEGGVFILKMLKTLINETRCKVMIATYPTGWNKLTKSSQDAYQEARQLLGRTIKPIETRWAKGVTADDVEAYIEGFAPTVGTDSKALAKRITGKVRDNGNLRLLADAIDNAAIMAEEANLPLSAIHIEKSVLNLCDGSLLEIN